MLWSLLICLSSLLIGVAPNNANKIKGLSFVGTPRPYTIDPFPELLSVNPSHIAVIPYGYTIVGQPKVHFNSTRQWWGEKSEGVRKTIQMAHDEGLSVMLKPQVYVPGSWVGEMNFNSKSEWEEWEASYTKYIMEMVDIAVSEDVAIFCIGTEFKTSVTQRPLFWRNLIAKIRVSFCGQLTYSSNWDHYQNVPIWDDLDYIGVSTYFPLCEKQTPSVNELVEAWQPIKKDLKHFSLEQSKPILFTEFGYLSVDHCAHKTWELENNIRSLNVNETAQANAFQAIFEVFWSESFWAGGFLWKWFPNGEGHEGYPHKDYTPQDKKAEEVIQNWYAK